jgi:putative mRNA 3-end processing factor
VDLLKFTSKGIYCPPAGVYLDPWKPVQKALITHAHSDHARSGSQEYLAHADSEALLRLRLGRNISLQTVRYGEEVHINGVRFSFHPAGHILGSSQIRVEYKGEVWVFSGDYKLEHDGFCAGFEPVRCHTFISESTFGLPVYRWKPQAEVFEEMNRWWAQNAAQGVCSVVVAYSLGKAQRILKYLDQSIGRVYAHPSIFTMHQTMRENGFQLPEDYLFDRNQKKEEYKSSLLLIPPAADGGEWMNKLGEYDQAFASGWMQVRGTRRRSNATKGFVLSDHADWDGLNTAVKLTEAERVIVTHGYTASFAQWLCEKGVRAEVAKTDYSSEG